MDKLKAEELLLGEGWSTQEFYNDHNRRAYRWTSGGASELFVDATVVSQVRIRGSLSGYVTDNRRVSFEVEGQVADARDNVTGDEQQFIVNLPNRPSQPVVKIVMKTGFFIPHRVVKNNDYRSLGMQVFSFQLVYRDQTMREVSVHLINNQLQYYDILKEERNKITGAKEIRRDSYGALHLTFDPGKRTGKMNMNGVLSFVGHRYGWSYVLGLLQQFHGEDGPMLDGFIDSTFRWNHLAVPPVNERQLPYQVPWFGFMHNPILGLPEWFTSHEMQPGSFLRSPMFQASLPTCKGLYVLAKPAADFLSDVLPVPVNHLYHPTGIPLPQHMFSMEKFETNPTASLVQVGWWCRRFRTLYDVGSPYRKVFLNPHVNNKASVDALRNIEANIEGYSISEELERTVHKEDFMSDQMYDVLLSNNIVILHLYDAIANNAIIECMARATPVLVNPLPCVVDYLGAEYPFYFRTVDEATKKLSSKSLIKETHEYLLNSGVADKVKPETFLRDLQETSIFKSL